MLNKLLIALCAVSLSFAVACSGGEVQPDEAVTETAVEEVEESVAVEEAVEEEAVAAEEEAAEGEYAEDSEPAEDEEGL